MGIFDWLYGKRDVKSDSTSAHHMQDRTAKPIAAENQETRKSETREVLEEAASGDRARQ